MADDGEEGWEAPDPPPLREKREKARNDSRAIASVALPHRSGGVPATFT
eukprot:gene29223-62899_t